MYRPCVFILTRRKELSIKHKKLIEALNLDVKIFSRLDEAILGIKNEEPEMIIVSDTVDDKLSDFIKKIRVLTFNFRPVIIGISKSGEMEDKLSALENGADDFLDESIPSKEFQARINAHARRYLENSVNPTTGFIDNKVTIKALKKHLRSGTKKAIMLVNISGINFYKEIYGEIAYEKVLQTTSAIINSTIQGDDIAGHYSNKEFMIITSVLKAEKVAEFLTFAFDNILERFYSEFDYKNNFMLYSSETIEEKKIPLMKLSTAVIEAGGKEEDEGILRNEKQVLSLLFNVLKLCKASEKSCYIIDRPKLYGKVSNIKPKNKVMVIEKDEALLCLLEYSLKSNGYDVRALCSYSSFLDEYDDFKPDVLILDYGSKDKKEGLNVLSRLRDSKNLKEDAPCKIIFSTTIQDKKEILSSGADFYLPKPYDINTLLDWVKKLL